MDRYDFNSTVSWGAILAGGFTAAAVSLIVIAFGVGVGLSVVSPWNGEGISATTTGWSAGLFLVVVAMRAVGRHWKTLGIFHWFSKTGAGDEVHAVHGQNHRDSS